MHPADAQLPVQEILAMAPSAWAPEAQQIGSSREGRPLLGLAIGRGSKRITLIGGCHADEPVGPALLDRLAGYLSGLPNEHALRRNLSWRLVPHVNPDGEERNRSWTDKTISTVDHLGEPDTGYDLATYLRSVVRELPGDDIEFGFPSASPTGPSEVRPENRAIADFLAAPGSSPAKIHLHGSFHGMGLAPGPWFLIERSWIERTEELRRALADRVRAMGYRLFDSQRHGEKGFHRIESGFSTRPDSRAMKEFFEERGEPAMAAKFRPSSMEFARFHGDDPLTLVTEMPLFLVSSLPDGFVEKHHLEKVRSRLLEGALQGRSELEKTARDLGVEPMPIRDQMRLQLRFLNQALPTATSA